MRLSPHVMYASKEEAQGVILEFHQVHPASKKQFRVVSELNFFIEEIE